MKNEKVKIKNFAIVVLCFIFGLFVASFALAKTDAEVLQPAGAKITYKKPVVIKKTLNVNKTLTVGTKKSNGKLYIKGIIENPLKGEKVVVKDNLYVKGNLEIDGDFKVKGRFEKVTVIYTKDLDDESVTTSKLAKKAVTTSRLDDKAVTSDNLDSDAVTSGKIKAGAVESSELAQNAVTADKIYAGAVTGEKIADSAVTSARISDATITKDDVNFTSYGFIKAGGYVTSAGTIQSQFNNLGGTITVSHPGAGQYVVSVPGMDWQRDLPIVAVFDTSSGEARINDMDDYGIQVYTSRSNGDVGNVGFVFLVF